MAKSQKSCLFAGVHPRRAPADQPAPAADQRRGAPARGPHPGDPEGEGTPHVDAADINARGVRRRHAVDRRGRQPRRHLVHRRAGEAAGRRRQVHLRGRRAAAAPHQTQKTVIVRRY